MEALREVEEGGVEGGRVSDSWNKSTVAFLPPPVPPVPQVRPIPPVLLVLSGLFVAGCKEALSRQFISFDCHLMSAHWFPLIGAPNVFTRFKWTFNLWTLTRADTAATAAIDSAQGSLRSIRPFLPRKKKENEIKDWWIFQESRRSIQRKTVSHSVAIG